MAPSTDTKTAKTPSKEVRGRTTARGASAELAEAIDAKTPAGSVTSGKSLIGDVIIAIKAYTKNKIALVII